MNDFYITNFLISVYFISEVKKTRTPKYLDANHSLRKWVSKYDNVLFENDLQNLVKEIGGWELS